MTIGGFFFFGNVAYKHLAGDEEFSKNVEIFLNFVKLLNTPRLQFD